MKVRACDRNGDEIMIPKNECEGQSSIDEAVKWLRALAND
jgi:hypothetical protein